MFITNIRQKLTTGEETGQSLISQRHILLEKIFEEGVVMPDNTIQNAINQVIISNDISVEISELRAKIAEKTAEIARLNSLINDDSGGKNDASSMVVDDNDDDDADVDDNDDDADVDDNDDDDAVSPNAISLDMNGGAKLQPHDYTESNHYLIDFLNEYKSYVPSSEINASNRLTVDLINDNITRFIITVINNLLSKHHNFIEEVKIIRQIK